MAAIKIFVLDFLCIYIFISLCKHLGMELQGHRMHTCLVASVVSDSSTPWTRASQAPFFMGFSQQEYWSGLPCPLQGIFPT